MQPSDSDLQFTLKIRQFPVRTALAINKSKGQTFKKCSSIQPASESTNGELHVAASRVGDGSNLDSAYTAQCHLNLVATQGAYIVYRESL